MRMSFRSTKEYCVNFGRKPEKKIRNKDKSLFSVNLEITEFDCFMQSQNNGKIFPPGNVLVFINLIFRIFCDTFEQSFNGEDSRQNIPRVRGI